MCILEKSCVGFGGIVNTRFFGLLLFSATFAYTLLGCNQGIDVYDEGLTVYGATQVLDGAVIYKDIWSNYGPGQYYLQALAFMFFGKQLIVERVLCSFVNAALVFCVYCLARKLVSRPLALFSWFFSLALLSKYPLYGRTAPTALLFCLISCLCLSQVFQKGGRRWLFLAGFFIGLSTVFRHDFGAYAFVSESLVIILFAVTEHCDQNLGRFGRLKAVVQKLAFLVIGIAVVVLPVSGVLFAHVSLGLLFEDLIFFPAIVYPKIREIPWPPFPSLQIFFSGHVSRFFHKVLDVFPAYSPITLILPAIYLCSSIRRRVVPGSTHWLGLVLLVEGVFFYNYSAVLSVVDHMVPQIIFASILLPWALVDFEAGRENKHYGFLRWLTIFAIVLASASFGRIFLQSTGDRMCLSKFGRKLTVLNLDRCKGFRLNREQAESLEQAIFYVQKATAPTERIFAGTSRHDRLWASDPMFYFLADRHNATRYSDMCPGLVTTEPVQKEIIKDLLSNRVRCIILTSAFEDVERTNISNESSGVVLLDNFIREYYNEAASFGYYSIRLINLKGEEKQISEVGKQRTENKAKN